MRLGRLGGAKVVPLLAQALERMDGVSRAAARELGRLKLPEGVEPMVKVLARKEVNQSCVEALAQIGEASVEPLIGALRDPAAEIRQRAAEALGQIGDRRALDGLVAVVQADPEYGVRTVAATALGQLKDARALWVLVGTLKLRDESAPEQQSALEALRQAASLAMRRIGDPLQKKQDGAGPKSVAEAVEELEGRLTGSDVHPRLLGDLGLLSVEELVEVMRELIQASEEVSWAKLESREPLLAPHFKSYEQRQQTAERVGKELHRRGGDALVQEVLKEQLEDYPAIKNWWNGIGDVVF